MLLRIFLLAFITPCFASAQVMFNFDRKYSDSQTKCVQLKESKKVLATIDDAIELFGEPTIVGSKRNIFRVVTLGSVDDAKSIEIRTIELIDSTCIVSTKFLSNPRKKQVLQHTKTYPVSRWNEFVELAKKALHQTTNTQARVIVNDGSRERYEFNFNGSYEVVFADESSADITFLREYLSYLISPIFESECP